jgi:hypothetical protein
MVVLLYAAPHKGNTENTLWRKKTQNKQHPRILKKGLLGKSPAVVSSFCMARERGKGRYGAMEQ